MDGLDNSQPSYLSLLLDSDPEEMWDGPYTSNELVSAAEQVKE